MDMKFECYENQFINKKKIKSMKIHNFKRQFFVFQSDFELNSISKCHQFKEEEKIGMVMLWKKKFKRENSAETLCNLHIYWITRKNVRTQCSFHKNYLWFLLHFFFHIWLFNFLVDSNFIFALSLSFYLCIE